MGLFTSKQLDTFDALLIDQLEDLYDAERGSPRRCRKWPRRHTIRP